MSDSRKSLSIYYSPFEFQGDPHTMIDARSMHLNLQIHRGLFRYLPNGEIKPDLADTWSFSSNKLELRVKLKDEKFNDGTKISAQHVVSSFARLFLVESSIAADLSSISGIEQLRKQNKLDNFGVKVVGENEVLFKLERANALLISQLATVDCAIIPVDINILFKSPMNSYQSNFIGAGPYKVSKTSSKGIELVKWRKDSMESRTPPDVVYIKMTKETEPAQILAQTLTDSLDQSAVPSDLKAKLQKAGWQTSVTEMTREYFLVLNPNLLSSSTRSWLAANIDQNRIAKFFGPGFIPAWGFIPPILPGFLQNKIDRKANKKPEDIIEVLIPQHWVERDRIKKSLVESWQGLNVTFKFVSQREWNQVKTGKKYQVIVNSRGIDYPDGISILNYFRSSLQGNYYFINDPQIDALLSEATTIFDQKVRERYYRNIQEIVIKKDVVVPLVFGTTASGLWSPAVLRVPPHPLGLHFLPFEMIEMKN